ncbi:MAG: hypothetical protein AAF492_32510 [Verrucomicrobiota bacterium]
MGHPAGFELQVAGELESVEFIKPIVGPDAKITGGLSLENGKTGRIEKSRMGAKVVSSDTAHIAKIMQLVPVPGELVVISRSFQFEGIGGLDEVFQIGPVVLGTDFVKAGRCITGIF